MVATTRDIQRRALPNGLIVITEMMPHVRSVSVGIWVNNGSRREVAAENGTAPIFLSTWFSRELTAVLPKISRGKWIQWEECSTRSPPKNRSASTPKCSMNICPLHSMCWQTWCFVSKLDADDVKKERQVVLEEIKMDLDNPEYMLHDIFTRGFWPEHSLGRPILGTPETVKQFSKEGLSGRFQKWFAPDQIVVTAAGNVTHEQVMALAEREFGQLKPSGEAEPESAPKTAAPIYLETKRDLEQVHLSSEFRAFR